MDTYLQQLRARATRAFNNNPISSALNRVRAIVGPAVALAEETDAPAQRALDALNNGKTPTPVQLAALELVIRAMRPAPLSQNGQLEDLPADAAHAFGQWSSFQDRVKPYLYSIGRLDLAVEQIHIGTGFLVSDDLLVTNKHVLKQLSRGTLVLEKGQAIVRFKREYECVPEEEPVPVVKVIAVHPSLDMALLQIESARLRDGRQPLAIATSEATPSSPVVAIGYPAEDTRNPEFVGAIFGDMLGVKRAAPGEVIEATSHSLFHDCSTLGGNSGSPVLAMNTAQVVGVHCEGMFMYRNEAVAGEAVGEFVKPYLSS